MKQITSVLSLRNPKCKLCEIHKSAKNVCIMGKDNTSARILLLGESPGMDEDKAGEPFVGSSGRMLDSIFKHLNLKRDEVYITNVLKCHPVYNTKPASSCFDICSTTYLRKEIEIIKPELIICLGGLSARTLLHELSIKVMEHREKIYYTTKPMPSGIPFIVTYHPGATFHNPEVLQFIVDDIAWALDLLEGKIKDKKDKSKYKKGTTISNIPRIAEMEYWDLDLETAGLDPFLPEKKILSLQLSVNEESGYYFDWTPEIAKELKQLIKEHKPAINGHNIKHDLKWLRIKAGINFTGKINDTLQNIHLLDENFPGKGLDVVLQTFTDMKGHKEAYQKLIKTYIKTHKEKKERIRDAMNRLYARAFKAIPEKIRIDYGAGDADGTGRLRRVFRPRLKEEGLIPLHQLMMGCVKMYTDMECNGMKIDEAKHQELIGEYGKIVRKQWKKLGKLSPYELNHRSYPQLKQLIYHDWKCYPHEVKVGKKRKRYTTSKDALTMILQDDLPDEVNQYISTLLEYRKAYKLHGTFLVGLNRFLREGYIHPTWNLAGPDTGRTSCNDPNAQQVDRKSIIRRMFVSRFGKDGVLVQVDVSQGELRIAAHEANVTPWIKLFNKGDVDFHTGTASELLGISLKKVDEEKRYCAKQCNFAKLFGSGAKTIAQEMIAYGVKEEQAYHFIEEWDNKFPEWKQFEEDCFEFIQEHGYIRNLFGRYRRLPIISSDYETLSLIKRQGVNAPIQGGLSDLNKLCGYNIWRRIQTMDSCLITAETHDSFLFDTRKRNVSTLIPIIKEEYEQVDTSRFEFKLKVPIKVDVKVGPNWKDMEEVK